MTHEDIYTKFMIEYDKANITSSYPSLTKYEIATILDKAYLALIARKLTGNNPRRAGFEIDNKAIEDLRPLVTTQKQLRNNSIQAHAANDNRYSPPSDMLYYLQSDLVSGGDLNSTLLINHEISNKFKVSKHNYPWIKTPVCYLQDDGIHVLTDPDENYNSYLLAVTYIKKPKSFVASLGETDIPDIPDNPDNPTDPDIPDTPDTYTYVYRLSDATHVASVAYNRTSYVISITGYEHVYKNGQFQKTNTFTLTHTIILQPNDSTDPKITTGTYTWHGQTLTYTITQEGKPSSGGDTPGGNDPDNPVNPDDPDTPIDPTKYLVSISILPANGGNVYGGDYYSPGESCGLNAVPKTGYTFKNYVINGLVITNKYYTFTVNSNVTVIANFEKIDVVNPEDGYTGSIYSIEPEMYIATVEDYETSHTINYTGIEKRYNNGVLINTIEYPESKRISFPINNTYEEIVISGTYTWNDVTASYKITQKAKELIIIEPGFTGFKYVLGPKLVKPVVEYNVTHFDIIFTGITYEYANGRLVNTNPTVLTHIVTFPENDSKDSKIYEGSYTWNGNTAFYYITQNGNPNIVEPDEPDTPIIPDDIIDVPSYSRFSIAPAYTDESGQFKQGAYCVTDFKLNSSVLLNATIPQNADITFETTKGNFFLIDNYDIGYASNGNASNALIIDNNTGKKWQLLHRSLDDSVTSRYYMRNYTLNVTLRIPYNGCKDYQIDFMLPSYWGRGYDSYIYELWGADANGLIWGVDATDKLKNCTYKQGPYRNSSILTFSVPKNDTHQYKKWIFSTAVYPDSMSNIFAGAQNTITLIQDAPHSKRIFYIKSSDVPHSSILNIRGGVDKYDRYFLLASSHIVTEDQWSIDNYSSTYVMVPDTVLSLYRITNAGGTSELQPIKSNYSYGNVIYNIYNTSNGFKFTKQ